MLTGGGADRLLRGEWVLDMAPPKNMTAQELIQKAAAEETTIKEARTHYVFTQDVLGQTLSGKAVDGQFHEIASVSYDDEGKRAESVTFAESPRCGAFSCRRMTWTTSVYSCRGCSRRRRRRNTT